VAQFAARLVYDGGKQTHDDRRSLMTERSVRRAELIREMERLYTDRAYTDIELAERLDAHRTTIYRARRFMEDDLALPFIHEGDGRYRLDRKKQMTGIQLSQMEALALYLGGRRLQQQTRIAHRPTASALEKDFCSSAWTLSVILSLFGALAIGIAIFMLAIGYGRTGSIRLGADDKKPGRRNGKELSPKVPLTVTWADRMVFEAEITGMWPDCAISYMPVLQARTAPPSRSRPRPSPPKAIAATCSPTRKRWSWCAPTTPFPRRSAAGCSTWPAS